MQHSSIQKNQRQMQIIFAKCSTPTPASCYEELNSFNVLLVEESLKTGSESVYNEYGSATLNKDKTKGDLVADFFDEL